MDTLFAILDREIANNRLKHTQLLFRKYQGKKAMKFVSVDSPEYKKKIKSLMNKFEDLFYLANESATTLTYIFKNAEY